MEVSIFQGQPRLLEAFRRGERCALERVYREHVRMLDGYLRALARAARARGVVHDCGIADSLQESFIRAFSPAARTAYDESRPYAPYLRRIAKNLFIDQLRAHGRGLEHLLGTLPDDAEAEPVECSAVADPLVAKLLSTYLGMLPPSLFDVYQQRFVLGHSQEEACSALGITRRRFRTDEERLKSGLRRALAEQGILRRDLGVRVAVRSAIGSPALR
jgi:RNA polymerase sigma factor (sigma-70 family)